MLSPLPKVIVATTTVTATTAPMRAERTGTAERPCPRSREKRSPATAGAASPARAATFTTLEPRSTGSPRSPRRRRAARRYASTTVKTLRPTTRRAKPDPSTVQSKAIPGVGSTSATGPRGAKGESPTAMARATSPPSTTLVSQPSVAPHVKIAGSAPRARRTSMSSPSDQRPRLIASPATSKVTRPAMAPNTPRAMDSGLLARSTCPSVTEVTWKV